MVVLLYKSGIPTQLTTQFSNVLSDIEGFLIEFVFQETITSTPVKYNFYFKSDFKDVDQKRTDLREGYYDEEQFLKYIENTGPNIPLGSDMIYGHKFDFTKYLAIAGDLISVNVTNFESPFDFFYDRSIYNFTIENNIDGEGVRSYCEAILDGFEPIDYKLSLPSTFSASSVIVQNQSNSAGGFFYAKNLGDYVNNFTNNDDKRKLKKITILIIFKIRYIVKEIFPYLINNSGFAIEDVDDIANNIDANLSGDPLNALKELLFTLKKSWGYYYDASSTLPHRSSLPTLFNAQSSYSDFEYYYIGLTSFYRKCYRIPHALSVFPNTIKLDYLIEILSINGLSVLPIDLIKKTLLRIINEGTSISEPVEQLVVRLVLSVSSSQANDFLDFLLEQGNCVNTNFERLFALLDDAPIERIPIASWFAEEKTNRMAFVYAINELWKVSKYNLLGSNQEVNTSSYFLNEGVNYFKEPNGNLKSIVLECGRLSSIDSGNPAILLQTNTWVDYDSDKTLKNELVTIYKNINITNHYLSTSGHSLGDAHSLDRDYKIPTQYHLYQPLILIGHQVDDRVVLPNCQPIPAFLFYYSDDFERLLKIDAQIALAVNIGIEVVLFFTLGGVTQLRHLQHLKYITKIRSALAGTLPAGEDVLVWAGLESGAQTTSITASMLYSLGQYNETILSTDAERKAREDANKAFLYIALAFGGGSMLCRYKAVESAEFALSDLAGTATMNPLVKSVMQTLVAQDVNAIISFNDRLTALQLDEVNVIATRYAAYSDELKKTFYRDFGSLNDVNQKDIWNALNKNSSLDNYEALRDLSIPERNEKAIFTSFNLKQAYVRYYNEAPLREVLERISINNRLTFLDNFSAQSEDWFNHLIDNPSAIERWDKFDSSAKLFAKEKPEIWLFRFDKVYENFSWASRLSDSEIIQRFGQEGLDLVNEVESAALNHIANNGNSLSKDVVIAGMKDKVSGQTFYNHNFSGYDFNNGAAFDIYKSSMFPNLKDRLDDVIAFNRKNYNMADIDYLGNVGRFPPGAHAEIRALNELAKFKFPNDLPTDEVFDVWLKNDVLGYNRNIMYGIGQENVIQHTCADCFYILDLITFIRP